MQLTSIFATALALTISVSGVLALPSSSQRDQGIAARSGAADTTSVDAAPSNLLRRLIHQTACMSIPCSPGGGNCPKRCGPCVAEDASLQKYYCSKGSGGGQRDESLFDRVFH